MSKFPTIKVNVSNNLFECNKVEFHQRVDSQFLRNYIDKTLGKYLYKQKALQLFNEIKHEINKFMHVLELNDVQYEKIYNHDCDECRYLGWYLDVVEDNYSYIINCYDLYIHTECIKEDEENRNYNTALIYRYSDEPADYVSINKDGFVKYKENEEKTQHLEEYFTELEEIEEKYGGKVINLSELDIRIFTEILKRKGYR